MKGDRKFNMASKHGPHDTLFGVIGSSLYDSHAQTLGGIVMETKSHMKAPVVSEKSAEKYNTERHIMGPASKTSIPGVHFSQVPFAGQFMSKVGTRV